MTIDDFWKKYNHCPKCEGYKLQGGRCVGCKFRTPYPKEWDADLFEPTQECIRAMNREIDEW